MNIEKLTKLPWELIAFIGIATKACALGIGMPESLIALGYLAYKAGSKLIEIKDKEVNKMLELKDKEVTSKLEGASYKHIEDRMASLEGKLTALGMVRPMR